MATVTAPKRKVLLRVKHGKHCILKPGQEARTAKDPLPEYDHFIADTPTAVFESECDLSVDMPEKFERVSTDLPVAANAAPVGVVPTAATEEDSPPVDLAGLGWKDVTQTFTNAVEAEVSVWKKGTAHLVVDPKDNQPLHKGELKKSQVSIFILKQLL